MPVFLVSMISACCENLRLMSKEQGDMKIAAPVSSLEEAEMLIHFGADEFYCGFSTPEWQEHFGGQWWMNRRDPSSANILSWQDMSELMALAHQNNIPVHVTLNAPFYPEGALRYMLKLSEKLANELGADALIVSDFNLLMLIRREKFPVGIHLSSLGACFNSFTADFYCSLGVKRIILPRHLTLSEINDLITKADPRMEFEVFGLNDGCFFEEGFCQTTHTLGPFCLTDWEIRASRESEQSKMSGHLDSVREHLWYQNNCGSSFQAQGLPNGPCSLCWFGHFRDWGVKAVKIVGREASFYRKMRSLQMVKAVADEAGKGGSAQEIAEFARSLRNTPEYCQKGYMCYFRESPHKLWRNYAHET